MPRVDPAVATEAAVRLREVDLAEMARAWRTWARSPDGFMAFAWCRALGRKPRR